jgi:deoxyxylulose-5-phosphate synthase
VIGKRDSKYLIISTGLTSQFIAEKIESISTSLSLEIKLLDIHQIKPIGLELQNELLSAVGILVIEESYNSSIAREVNNILVSLEKKVKLVVLDVGEYYIFRGNYRQSMNNLVGISEASILEALVTISKAK